MIPSVSSARRSARAPGLTCTHCGHTFAAVAWQPLLRCPRCHTPGYIDHAGRYLLPTGWECASCGAANDGLANFCTTCGTGLASRCLRCGAPVYSAVCHTCGTHQARARHLEAAAARRELGAKPSGEWAPASRRRALKRPAARRRLPVRATRRWAWRSAAALALVSVVYAGRGWLAVAWAQVGALARPPLDAGRAWLLGWWQAFSASLEQPPGPSEPEYAYLFATIIFQIALLPVLIYLLGRVIRRLL